MHEFRPPRFREKRAAFTLVELLVCVSIIALLLSILLPGLGKARAQAKAVVCSAGLSGFSSGLATYLHEEDEWIPGLNTSGLSLLTQTFGSGAAQNMSRPELPVQWWDWMTPLLNKTMNLPADRARKFRMLLDDFRCPSMRLKSALWQSGRVADEDRFEAEVESRGKYPGVSYLMPAHFQLWGYRDNTVIGSIQIGSNRIPLRARSGASPDCRPWEVAVERYTSLLEQVGSPSEKIAVADGTRFLPRQGPLDFDYSPCPGVEHGSCGGDLRVPRRGFGAFATAGGWWRGSEAYGDQPPDNSSAGRNIPLSYRHNDGIQALFFDGHVERLSRKRSRKIDYWYPKGAFVVEDMEAEGYTDYETYPAGYVVR